ncbi:MAG TPA: hypothetical protein VLE72_01665 [Candidatus Saccharimonadales bacterium]|nr:hypothetical protein [Candidatus Saccharimonadales bacterium]
MPESTTIPGVRLIRHNASQIDEPDDPDYPFKLTASFTPPEFMQFTFVLLYGGSEEVAVIAKSREAMDAFIEESDFGNHPRLRELTITGPDGTDTVKVGRYFGHVRG